MPTTERIKLPPEEDLFELRLFLQELVCNICRFKHVAEQNITPQEVRIRQEFSFGVPCAFSDIFIQAPDQVNYFVEIMYGYSADRVVESINRKYGDVQPFFKDITKLIIVIDRDSEHDREECIKRVTAIIPSSWELEIWDEPRLLSLIREQFNIKIDSIAMDQLLELGEAIDRAKGSYAFGDAYNNDPLDGSLLWQFGYWRLRELFNAANRNKRLILPPVSYPDVAVIYADLSGFSGYVRDTTNKNTIKDCLSAFCAKARHQILSEGGMLYQFLGDAVIGLFGIPDHAPDCAERGFECARSLLMLGDAISNEWQRQLDRMQPVSGSHIGIAMGDIQVLSFRPFSRTHTGAISDAVNMAARLSSHAKPGQIVASNTFYRSLGKESQGLLHETDPVEAKNIGSIKAWAYNEYQCGK